MVALLWRSVVAWFVSRLQRCRVLAVTFCILMGCVIDDRSVAAIVVKTFYMSIMHCDTYDGDSPAASAGSIKRSIVLGRDAWHSFDRIREYGWEDMNAIHDTHVDSCFMFLHHPPVPLCGLLIVQ